ncbi:MAG: hypothetical protein GY810_08155 [Aureispira sp.]|nr:hypothetical protein [Aureispira sp.]
MYKHILFITLILLVGVQYGFAQPPNDEPCSATALTVNTTCNNTSGTNVAATASTTPTPPAPGCGSYSGGDVWFSVVVPVGGAISIETSTNGGFTDGGLALYSGACGSLTLIECDDDDGPGAMSLISRTGLTPGNTMYIRVWEYGNNSFGTFNICVTEPAGIPANDDCGCAIAVPVNPDFNVL